MQRNRTMMWVIAALVALVIVVGVIFFLSRKGSTTLPAETSTTTTTQIAKPQLIAKTYNGCPPSGDGGDPALNTLKNRIDEANWQPVTVASILSLTWPQSIEHQSRARWSVADKENIAANEGAPISLEGYLVDGKQMSPESCNCHSVNDVDFHIWMVDDAKKDRTQSIVVEVSPRVRAVHPAWTLKNIRQIATTHRRVRISGWLMMDPEHPDQLGKTRGTIWEVHPIMQIETEQGGAWTPLDNGTTGVSSSVAQAAATAPAVTPEATATMPPAGNAKVQDNNTVQITALNADGKKGSAEPDEYVEITNKGTESVDITDWVLQDEGARNEYKWDAYTMKPGERIRVYTNETHPESGGFSFGSARSIWANSGDVAQLFDVDKLLVSRYAYGNKK